MDYSDLLLLLHPISFTGFILIFIFLLQKWNQTSPSSAASPPSPPKKLPIFGHLLNLGSHPHITLQRHARRHGPLFLLHLGSKPTVVVSSADAAREVMKTHDLIFSNRPKWSMSQKLLYDSKDIAASPYGDYWRQMKTVAVVHLLSNKRVHSFRSVREEEVKSMLENIERRRSMSSSIDLSEMFSVLTNDVVCRVAFGRKYGGKLRSVLLEFGKLLGSFSIRDFIPWLGWIDFVSGLDGKAERVAKELDEFLNRVIEDHVHDEDDVHEEDDEKEKEDLVDVLLRIQREDSIGFPLEIKSLKALILDMFAAGTDTTYTVLEWAMSELLRHPKVMKKLQNEIKEKTGEKEFITEDDLEKMLYLKAVIKETLRLHPPIPLLVPRESTQDIELKSYQIRAKTRVVINAWAIGRDPDVWELDAEEFRPERFLNERRLIDFKGHDFELIPFGAGRRGCPGILFATIINELALANLLHKFEWTLPNGVDGKDLDMTGVFGLTIHRKFPLVVVPSLLDRDAT